MAALLLLAAVLVSLGIGALDLLFHIDNYGHNESLLCKKPPPGSDDKVRCADWIEWSAVLGPALIWLGATACAGVMRTLRPLRVSLFLMGLPILLALVSFV